MYFAQICFESLFVADFMSFIRNIGNHFFFQKENFFWIFFSQNLFGQFFSKIISEISFPRKNLKIFFDFLEPFLSALVEFKDFYA